MNINLLIVLLILSQMIFLLPIKDERNRKQGYPWMTVSLIALNTLIHIWVTLTIYSQLDAGSDESGWGNFYLFMEVPQLILNREGLGALSSLTSIFLHADFGHLLGNMIFLWFFGRKVEDLTGPLRFSLFYLFCGFTASLVSVMARSALSPANAHIPGLGASGAIAGVMGAYLFLYSDQRVLTLVSARLDPLLPLPSICFLPIPIPLRLPAWVFLIYSFLKDALLGQLALELAKQQGGIPLGVNVFAHLGGAAGGLVFIYFFLHPEALAYRH